MNPSRVAYLLKMYPRFSETFILNEILELERQGVDLHVFALKRPDEGRFHADVARVRDCFRLLRALRDRAVTVHPGLTGLSMGMSGDYETAVAFGATSVRVGSAIFGAR